MAQAQAEAEAALLGDAWHPRALLFRPALKNCDFVHRFSRAGDETAIVFEFCGAA
jgi:hypothetical protein